MKHLLRVLTVHTVVLFSGLATCGAEAPLTGVCSSDKRVTTDATYRDLALRMAVRRVANNFRVGNATPESVAQRKAYLAEVRATWLPQIADECLRSHADYWLTFYEREADRALADRERLAGYASSYDKEQAEKDEQARNLADRLGVRP